MSRMGYGYFIIDLKNDMIRFYFSAQSDKAAIKWAKLYYNLNSGQYVIVRKVNVRNL